MRYFLKYYVLYYVFLIPIIIFEGLFILGFVVFKLLTMLERLAERWTRPY